ncbi:MAG: bifunctional folylpolyglutamate synthase/dihydrofolate synthase [Acidobacteria bacterium]|nr:bifunctional folylpolyglutamate synthase/dihydrofolate synthase [Acidobacteriota bacterium]
MSVAYQNAVARMYALGHELQHPPASKFDLAHMQALLSGLENPERRFPSVLIAGTNGKGSTAATLASILATSGLRTGLYTSPHLMRINERIRVDGDAIDDEKFALLHDLVDRTAERLIEDGELASHPSFFEMLTAIAFEYFSTAKLDIAVLEVGMGGRLDATNVVEPRVSVITDISLDHQKFLGDTVAQIAREKAGIIRPGGIVVTLPQAPEANDVIGNAILEKNARAVSAADYVPSLTAHVPPLTTWAGTKTSRYALELMGKEILVETPLLGRHQLRNTALAIATAEQLGAQGFSISPQAIEQGIRRTRWPGRFQVLPPTGARGEVVLDVAHNPAGAWALRSSLSAYYENRRLVMVFGAMRDKAIGEIAEILFPLADLVIATQAGNPRSATGEDIREAGARTHTQFELTRSVSAALERACRLAAGEALVVVTGSIYVVGEAMQALGVSPDGQ